MEMINVTIDGKSYKVPENYTVLKACREAGVYVPTLCYLEGINQVGSCRLCLVEVERQKNLKASCFACCRGYGN